MPYLKKVERFFNITHSQALFLFRVSDGCEKVCFRFCFYKIVDNGKRLCEMRAKMNEKFSFNRAEQIAFSDDQFKEKSNMKNKLRLKKSSRYSSPRIL